MQTTVQVRFLSRPLEKLVRGLKWKSVELSSFEGSLLQCDT